MALHTDRHRVLSYQSSFGRRSGHSSETFKKPKTVAEDGLVAEMLKTGHASLLQSLSDFFNELLSGQQQPPDEWRKSMLKVLFKKGDSNWPSNYRPISIIPVLAKLFSTMLHGRIAEILDKEFSEEQFGFRKGRGCSDAVHSLRMIIEKSLEWGEKLWIATLDVEKVFDKVHHTA